MLMFYTFFPWEEFLFPYISHKIVWFSYFNFTICCRESQVCLCEDFFLSGLNKTKSHQWHLCGFDFMYLVAVQVDFQNLVPKLFRVKERFYATFILWLLH